MSHPDPRLIDHPVDPRVIPAPPSWPAIIVAWAAGIGLICMIWSF